jgi:hypothetical protein
MSRQFTRSIPEDPQKAQLKDGREQGSVFEACSIQIRALHRSEKAG